MGGGKCSDSILGCCMLCACLRKYCLLMCQGTGEPRGISGGSNNSQAKISAVLKKNKTCFSLYKLNKTTLLCVSMLQNKINK